MKEVRVWDETLRDGEQMPGVVFSYDEKKELAEKSSKFGSDIISIMPSISPLEEELTRELCNSEIGYKINAMCRLDKTAIDLVKSCQAQRIFLFTSVSDIHLKYKLKTDKDSNLKKSLEFIDYAKSLGLIVDFGVEDATRANQKYLLEFMNAVAPNIDYFMPADTLGVLTPNQTYNFVKKLKQKTNCKICMHCHNDFGLATANTLAGIKAGADIFSGTFTGIGERGGNAPIEEIVVSLKYQHAQNLPINYLELGNLCKLVETYSQITLQKHKPISGENAFSHESGLHIDGILKNPHTYENFDPTTSGRKRRFLFGKHSGKNGLTHILKKNYSQERILEILSYLKQKSTDEKRAFTAEEVLEIIADM